MGAADTVAVTDTASASKADVDSESDFGDFECRDTDTCPSLSFNYFIAPRFDESIDVKLNFWKKHPVQPIPKENAYPFQPNKLYYKRLPNNDRIQRKWLSYSEELNQLFCSNCMVFGSKSTSNVPSPFIVGYKVNVKHVYDAVNTHENSKEHFESTTAALQCVSGKSVDDLMYKNMREKHLSEVEDRRKVLSRIIDIIIFLGKRGLAFRGKMEGAYNLGQGAVDEKNIGNFLALVLLVGKYDTILGNHVKKCEFLSKKRKMKSGSSKGRGSLITFLSKTTVRKLIIIIGKAVQTYIIDELKKCRKFSLMVDSTQDVAVMDQLAVCVRYVENGRKARERLLHLLNIHDASGEGLFNEIKKLFETFELDTSDVVGCSFDGAANMKGEFNGLKTKLAAAIYTHCQAHVLNLVMGDTVSSCRKVENLFGLVQQCAVFLSQSYKRMDAWKNKVATMHGHDKLRRFSKIGETRWWSKDKALSSIFELPVKITTIEQSRFITFLTFLQSIIDRRAKFDPKTKFLARSLIDNWMKFDVIFTAVLILDLFSITTPVSKYLQSISLDYLRAWKMVDTMLDQLKSKRNEQHFLKLYEKTKLFAKKCNEFFSNEAEKDEVHESDADEDGRSAREENFLIELEEDFKVKRTPIRKRRNDEQAGGEQPNFDACQDFRINVFYNIIDNAVGSIGARFIPNKELYMDCAWLDPTKFSDISKMKSIAEFPTSTFSKISELTGLPRTSLLEELLQLSGQYENLTKNFRKLYEATTETEQEKGMRMHDPAADDEDVEELDPASHSDDENCTSCLSCLLIILQDLTTMSGMFHNLYSAVKFVLLLPCTQVYCERCFSKLKKLKDCSRSLLGQDLLNPLLLMFTEPDILGKINIDEIINAYGRSSDELKKLLF